MGRGKLIRSSKGTQMSVYQESLKRNDPGVITEALIQRSYQGSLPRGEAGKLAREVGWNPRAIEELKIEYQNILEINNLHHLERLKKLQLCNNFIAKIQNLNSLTNLVWLDLSFNNIKKIQNLSSLKRLEVLNLHRNFIDTIENIDDLRKLEMFHISHNELANMEQIKILAKFANLRSVSFKGNPMAEKPEFSKYLIGFVPQITVLDFYSVTPDIRAAAEEFISSTKSKREADTINMSKGFQSSEMSIKPREEDVEYVRSAECQWLADDKIWNSLLENDVEGTALLQLHMVEEIAQSYKDKFIELPIEFVNEGIQTQMRKKKELQTYDEALREEKLVVKKMANKLTEEFIPYSQKTLKDIVVLVSVIQDNERRLQNGLIYELPPEFKSWKDHLNQLAKEYVLKLHNLWVEIMNEEVTLSNLIEEVNKNLENELKNILEPWVERISPFFEDLKNLERDYQEEILAILTDNLGPATAENTDQSFHSSEKTDLESEQDQNVKPQTPPTPNPEGKKTETHRSSSSSSATSSTDSKAEPIYQGKEDPYASSQEEYTTTSGAVESLVTDTKAIEKLNLESEKQAVSKYLTEVDENLKKHLETKQLIYRSRHRSMDHRMNYINTKENEMSSSMKACYENCGLDLQGIEHQRSRLRLSEISHFVETYFENLKQTGVLDYVDAYVPDVKEDQDLEERPEGKPISWYQRLAERLQTKEKKPLRKIDLFDAPWNN